MPRPPLPDANSDIPRPRNTIATNLSPERAQPLQKRIHKSRLHRRPRRRLPETPEISEEDALFQSITSISDVSIAVQTLHSTWPQEAWIQLPRTPPIVFVQQVHALVAESSTIDEEVENLVVDEWRKIIVPGGDEALIKVDDFELSATSDIGRRFVTMIKQHIKETLVAQESLEDEFDNAEIDVLVKEGLLRMEDTTTFWLTVPSLGDILRNRNSGNKEMLSIVKRAPYKEMLIEKLEMRTLKKSIFTAQWHVRDMVGAKVFETVATSLGTLVRLRDTRS